MSDLPLPVLCSSPRQLWLGWSLLPIKLGAFLEPGDFASIRQRFRLWIWLYRVHLFGYVMMLMAFVALGTIASSPPVLVWPAVAVLGAASIVAAVAQAFYHDFGAWGAVQMQGKESVALAAYLESLRVPTEYATCLVRFGRVFFGLGQVVLAIALWHALPLWLSASTGILGIAAMAVTMALPDNLDYYKPLFHLNALWLLAMGVVLLSATA
ncbi:MAG: hypothetical protein ACREV9_04260 [Burkholderiales bacterium]